VTAVSPEAIQIVQEATKAAGTPVPAGWGANRLVGDSGRQVRGPTPQLGRRSDGLSLLYPEKVHSLAGESEAASQGLGWVPL